MVRQAHTYLVGAMSGATLIAVAIAVFVVLVSAQVFSRWPIVALGGDSDSAAVSKAHPAAGSAADAAGALVAATTAARKAAAATARLGGGNGNGGNDAVAGSDGVGSSGGSEVTTTGPDEPAGNAGPQDGGSGNATSPQSPATTSPSGSSGSSSSGGGSTGGGATSGSGGGSTGATTPTTSAQVTETVNGTVTKVDETALGGTLQETGVTGVTESVVNGVAGPESTVGKVVDETVGVVGGLLGGKR